MIKDWVQTARGGRGGLGEFSLRRSDVQMNVLTWMNLLWQKEVGT